MQKPIIASMLATVAILFVLTAPLPAQKVVYPAVTQAGIDVFIDVGNSPPEAALALTRDFGDEYFALIAQKINFYLKLVLSGQNPDTNRAAFDSNPAFSYTPRELAVLERNRDRLYALHQRATGGPSMRTVEYPTITQADIDKLLNSTSDSVGSQAVAAKMGFYCGLVNQGLDAASRQAVYDTNPTFTFTPQEVALLDRNQDRLMAFYRKLTGLDIQK